MWQLFCYNQHYLIPSFESIFDEYSKLMNNNAYKEALTDTANDIIRNANDNLLLIGYDLLILHQDEAFEFLKEAGVEVNEFSQESVDIVKRKILSQINKKNIDKIRNQIKQTTEDSQTFEDFVAQVEMGLERSIDVNLLTLKEWCAKVKSLDKKMEQQRKQAKNG